MTLFSRFFNVLRSWWDARTDQEGLYLQQMRRLASYQEFEQRRIEALPQRFQRRMEESAR